MRRLTTAVTRLVADANRGMSRAFDVNRIALLGVAASDGPLTPSEAAGRLGLPASSVTRHAQALADAGHLVIERNPSDARSALLRATGAGTAELAAVADIGADVFGGVVADWSDADIATLAGLTERLVTSWEAHGHAQQTRTRSRGRRARWQHPDPSAEPTEPSDRSQS